MFKLHLGKWFISGFIFAKKKKDSVLKRHVKVNTDVLMQFMGLIESSLELLDFCQRMTLMWSSGFPAGFCKVFMCIKYLK